MECPCPFGEGEEPPPGGSQSYYGSDTGTSDSNGYLFLSVSALPGDLVLMRVYRLSAQYATISFQNNSTSTATTLFPEFHIGADDDLNGVVDVWEMPLAQKFCPVLFAPVEDRGNLFGGGLITLRPSPVEVFDIDGPNGTPDVKLTYHDVYVEVSNINGQSVGEWEMEELTVAGVPYSTFYPERVHHNHEIHFFTPPGHATATYFLHPHYEWATNDSPEYNDVWYGLWEQIYNSNPQNSLIRDGISYVSFVSNTNDFTIEYRLHYPFNASSGRHEGDWPTIKVTVDSQDPTDAQIISVSYPFHGLRTVRTQPLPFSQQEAESFWQEVYYEEGETHPARFKYFVIDGTHPVSFSGGRVDEGGVEGWGSHAQYPLLGTWIREVTFASVDIEEYVVENGSISDETIQIDFNSFQNIMIIPPKGHVVANLITDPDYNWLVFGGYWGHRFTTPTGTFLGLAIGNEAALGPYGGIVASNEIRF